MVPGGFFGGAESALCQPGDKAAQGVSLCRCEGSDVPLPHSPIAEECCCSCSPTPCRSWSPLTVGSGVVLYSSEMKCLMLRAMCQCEPRSTCLSARQDRTQLPSCRQHQLGDQMEHFPSQLSAQVWSEELLSRWCSHLALHLPLMVTAASSHHTRSPCSSQSSMSVCTEPWHR